MISIPSLNPQHPSADPMRQAQVLFDGSSADNSGAFVTNPRAWAGFAAAALPSNAGGRLLLNDKRGKSRVDFFALFASPAAYARVQLFRYDFISTEDVAQAQRGLLTPLDDAVHASLGLGYPLAAKFDAMNFEFRATAHVQKLTVVGNVALPDQTSGTDFYVSNPLTDDLVGAAAFLPIVNQISAGRLVLCGWIT